MKTTKTTAWIAASAAVLTSVALFRALAAEPATASTNSDTLSNSDKDKTYTGTVSSIDPQTHVLGVQGWTTLSKKFIFNDSCTFAQLDKNKASAKDLRIGERVSVSFEEVNGAVVANRVQQEAMRFEGTVKDINLKTNLMVLHQTALDKELLLPVDCKIVLYDGKPGALADIESGDHVMAIFETPNATPIARQILKVSIPFKATLSAVDAEKQTVTARTSSATKTFAVAANCVYAVNGLTDAKIKDLNVRLGDHFVFSYETINGVETVSRIASAEPPPNTVAVAIPAGDY
ncbi:MAG TPA: hypothetical protein VG347_13635 [Verrucomicrobiae bacterium]|nr:hypothetical protein [Verrucomicrobiae bacterium]